MKPQCPRCATSSTPSASRPTFVRAGFFRRKSDCKWVQRFRCRACAKYFSTATFHECFLQKKRILNYKIAKELYSGVSQRRIARNFGISRTTVARKFRFLAERAAVEIRESNLLQPKALVMEFDDLETFEHSKCKPLSVSLAVETKSRRILGFEVSKMPAKGRLARQAFKKYGPRPDERPRGRAKLFGTIKPLITETALIKSDQNPFYPADVRRFFPHATHETFKGQRGSIVGQGELKKIRFDPLFSLNHTCAMLRANINRLFRRTWCTTKIAENLAHHIAIYAAFHNKELINTS